MSKKKYKFSDYCNFPVSMLEGFFDNMHSRLKDIEGFGLILLSDKDQMDFYTVMELTGTAFKEEDEQECWKVFLKNMHSASAKTGIEFKKLHSYQRSAADGKLNDEEAMLLLAFLAAKSIVGNKAIVKTNDLMLFARMNGRSRAFANDEELMLQSHPRVSAFYTRRKRERLRARMASVMHVLVYAPKNCRGYYLSAKYKTLDALALAVESGRKPPATPAAYRRLQAEARARAIKRLDSVAAPEPDDDL